MSVAHTAEAVAVSLPAGGPGLRTVLRVRELSATTLLVAASGEVDAANCPEVSVFVESHLTGYTQLVLDLSRLTFFSAAGFSALHNLNARCSRRGIDWVLVPGPEVERMLKVCDPEAPLPIAGNIVSAVAALANSPRRRLRLNTPH